MPRSRLLAAIAVPILVAACSAPAAPSTAWTFPPGTDAPRPAPSGSAVVGIAREATMYRSPTCGCCGEYGTYLEAAGWAVAIEMTEDTASLKRERGIPEAAWSCHTMVVDGYVIEGHVPLAAIEDLLARRPAVEGIALPGMPPGSPGMGGEKTGDFVVVSFVAGATTEFGRY
jgi:hypothetical protein